MRAKAVVPVLATAVAALLAPVVAAPPAQAAAPGCPAHRPTSIGGAIYGVDGRSLNALVGIDLVDAQNKKVDRDGRRTSIATYLYRERINPTIPPEGSTDRRLTRTWGDPSTNGYFCVSSKVKMAYLEVYPQNAARHARTTKSRYGGAAHHAQVLTPGRKHDVLLRLPLVRSLRGQVGYVAGYVTYRGKAVDPANLVIRVFPRRPGAQCGIEGFSASADQLFVTNGRTRYVVDHIAGGRCGAASQTYDVRITCKCGGGSILRRTFLEVRTGRGTPFSVAF